MFVHSVLYINQTLKLPCKALIHWSIVYEVVGKNVFYRWSLFAQIISTVCWLYRITNSQRMQYIKCNPNEIIERESTLIHIIGSRVVQSSKALHFSARGVTTDPGSIPGCITTGRDWEYHRAAHNWPSIGKQHSFSLEPEFWIFLLLFAPDFICQSTKVLSNSVTR